MKLLYLCNGSLPIVYREVKKLPLLSIDRGKPQVAIGAYCLMPNHFHILVKGTKEGGITKFMSKLLTAYSSYFNKKYERTGALFGSEFKSAHIDTDEYLKYIFSYIHLNPVKKLTQDTDEAIKYLDKYEYSSYPDYVGVDREESCLINKLAFPDYFLKAEDLKKDHVEWLSYPHLTKALPWETVDNSND